MLPAFGEAENLELLLPRLRAVLDDAGIGSEIVVVDTLESLDSTESVCHEHGVVHVRRQPNNSYGAAVRAGIGQARGTYTVFMDADGSHPPEFVPRLFALRERYRVVIASRYMAGGATRNSALLVLMSRIVNTVFSLVLGWHINDVSNSLRLYHTVDLQGLELQCQNRDVIEEMLFKIIRQHSAAAIMEIPFVFQQRLHGRSKRSLLTFIGSYFLTLVKLRLSLLR